MKDDGAAAAVLTLAPPAVMPESLPRAAPDSNQGAETIPSHPAMDAPQRPEATIGAEAPAPEEARAGNAVTQGAQIEKPASVSEKSASVSEKSAALNITQGAAPTAGAGEAQRQRAATATRGVVDDSSVRPRAEKLRRASTVVLDEAAADPGLRFVLVAAALVIISLLLLVLARLI